MEKSRLDVLVLMTSGAGNPSSCTGTVDHTRSAFGVRMHDVANHPPPCIPFPERELCASVPYSDVENPSGMDDMEQARLVRLALSMVIDREAINTEFLDGMGIALYSEYMGPEYPV